MIRDVAGAFAILAFMTALLVIASQAPRPTHDPISHDVHFWSPR